MYNNTNLNIDKSVRMAIVIEPDESFCLKYFCQRLIPGL